MAKANAVVTCKPEWTDGKLTAVVYGVAGMDDIRMDLAAVHQSNRDYAEFHGWKQRGVDTAAISRDPKTGQAASPADKRDAIAKLVDHYMSGSEKWSRVAEGDAKGGLLFDALCRVYGHMKAPSEIRAWLDGLTDKQQAALREDDEIAPVIATIKRERAAAGEGEKVDTKGLLGTLKAAA